MIIFYLILFIIIYIYLINIKEHFGLQTSASRMSIDRMYYDDQIFDKVDYIPNSQDIGEDGVTGWIKCMRDCDGTCLEYGISGNSYCFHKI